jgi:hypothetical protein
VVLGSKNYLPIEREAIGGIKKSRSKSMRRRCNHRKTGVWRANKLACIISFISDDEMELAKSFENQMRLEFTEDNIVVLIREE